ncbi:MAG: TetR/AcrR family transcriptional regulator [Lachnospiraceae bacterium]|nr:TetR/AcrR family transcriptional regulator [Lachnospiraceae bacterium]
MNEKFFDLKKEKQDRMINGALKVFALNGYGHASCDDIVKEAGISKGLLFHYFESKLGVYTFVYDYSVKFMSLEIKSRVSDKEKDLFKLIKQVEYARMQVMCGYPFMQLFLNRAENEDVSEALLATEEMKNKMQEVLEGIYSQSTTCLSDEKVDINRVRKMLEYTIKGLLADHHMSGSFRPDMVYDEITEYIDMVKEFTVKEG